MNFTLFADLLDVDLELPQRYVGVVAKTLSADESAAGKLSEKWSKTPIVSFIKEVFARAEDLLVAFTEEDWDCFIQATVFYILQDNRDTDACVRIIVEALVANTETTKESGRKRLRALTTLLNLISNPQSKFVILDAILEYARVMKIQNLVLHFHTRIDFWATHWGLNDTQKRKMYQKMSEILSMSDKSSLALNFLIKFFGTYQGVSSYPEDVKEIAVKAVVSAINSPVSSYADRNRLLESFANQGFQGELGQLLQLLKIVCSGSMEQFKSFANDNKALLNKYNMEHDDILYKLRLMSLCSLGCDANHLSYSDVAKALQIDESDVEMWIVDGVSQGLLEAQMDQFACTVSISRCARRSFGLEQWKTVQEKLNKIQESIKRAADSI